MGSTVDLQNGFKTGRLTVRQELPERNIGAVMVLCDCECGRQVVARKSVLSAGKQQSCGCLAREETVARNTTHGETGTALFLRWQTMLNRTTPHFKDARNYEQRGIAVCERWRTYENFREDMGEGFSPELTLERLDNNKGYEPNNCKWVTFQQNQRNRRNNHRITWDGRTQTLVEWAEEQKIPANTLLYRIRRGWPLERALTEGINR